MVNNRQITTGFNRDKQEQGIILEALKDVKHTYDGHSLKKGQTITVPKSQAKELLKQDGLFRIKMG